jgi:hypothetical protein
MTNEVEKQFFDTFGIEPHIRHWQQYNYAQVENGLKLFPERQKLADEGYIKITCKKLNPTEFNDCVYWEEYHYPQITDSILLELICIAHTSPVITFVARDVKSLKEEVLMVLCNWVNNRNIKQQVQALFEEK